MLNLRSVNKEIASHFKVDKLLQVESPIVDTKLDQCINLTLSEGNITTLQTLMTKKPNLNYETPIQKALDYENFTLADDLLRRSDISLKNLFLRAIRNGSLKTITFLLDHDPKLAIQKYTFEPYGSFTPFEIASRFDKPEVMHLLTNANKQELCLITHNQRIEPHQPIVNEKKLDLTPLSGVKSEPNSIFQTCKNHWFLSALGISAVATAIYYLWEKCTAADEDDEPENKRDDAQKKASTQKAKAA
jgi:hypothetical protein